jgi:4a-hydroxytetrahydrobiopterin dehydratase
MPGNRDMHPYRRPRALREEDGGMTTLLDDERVAAALDELTSWQRDGDTIVRTAKLPTFPAAIEAVRAVAEIAEARNHHPDIDIRWRTVTFRCSTHSKGGITNLDIELASEIDRVIADASAAS